jgi:O-antigen/teichoic acid export membrane protein
MPEAGAPGGRVARLAADRRFGALFGIANQAVISLANLAIGLAVLRFGSKEGFGLYSLGYMAVIVASGFAGGLFAAQLPARLLQRPEAARARFAGALFAAQVALSLGLCLLLLGLGSAMGLAAPVGGGPVAQTIFVALLAAPCAMALDYLRAHRLVLHRPASALGLDLLNAVVWAGLTLAGWQAGWPLHLAALAGYGAACLATILIGLRGTGLEAGPMRPALAEAWEQGRWALGGVLVTVAQNNAHLYLLAWLQGTGAAAEMNAARLLVAPVALITVGVNRTLIPRMAAQQAAGEAAQQALLQRQALLLVLGAMAAYGLLLALGWGWVRAVVLPAGYAAVGLLALGWGLVFALQAVSESFSARLQARGRFRGLTLANALTALPVLAGVGPLILLAGPAGSLVALGAGQMALSVLLRREVRLR